MVKKIKIYTFREDLREQLKDPRFKKSFEKERSKLQLGYQIHLAREKAGMTQQELARKIGTRQSNISRLECGDYNFTIEMLDKISRALGVRLKIEIQSRNQEKAA